MRGDRSTGCDGTVPLLVLREERGREVAVVEVLADVRLKERADLIVERARREGVGPATGCAAHSLGQHGEDRLPHVWVAGDAAPQAHPLTGRPLGVLLLQPDQSLVFVAGTLV